MDIKEETHKLLAIRLLTFFDSKKFVDWAMILLQNGYESESLVILAGLDNDTTEEREKYFWQSIDELQLDIIKDDFELISNYAIYIAKAVMDNQLNPISGLEVMQSIVQGSGYSKRFIPFYEIEEDLDYLKYDNMTIFNSGLTLENVENVIKKEFELFLEAERLKITDEVRESSYCQKCKSIAVPKLKKMFRLRRPHIVQIWVCSKCGSRKLNHFCTQDGKEIILKEMKNVIQKYA
jgi:TRAP-type uncharacterized transport system, periplasmic component